MEAEDSRTLMLRCPTCGSDAADTLGVTGDVNGSPEAAVVMRCEECSTVYLSPAPIEHAGSPPRLPASALTRRRIHRWTRGLPPGARILCVDGPTGEYRAALSRAGDRGWVIESMDLAQRSAELGTAGVAIREASAGDGLPEPGAYDLILLPRSLESALDPSALLTRVAGLLASGGRVVAIVNNAGSSCFAAFGGRHWSGYQYPNTRQHLTPQALRWLGSSVGLRIRELDTVFAPDTWLASMANWLRDWGASDGVIRLLSGRWLVPAAMTAILEGIAAMRGRGSLLVAQLARQ